MRNYRHRGTGQSLRSAALTPSASTLTWTASCAQDQFSQLKSHHAIGIHGYVLVYSITSRASFDMIQVIYDKIVNYSGLPEIAAVIVGSKTDLHMRWVRSSRCIRLD
jgi:SNF family Na+-dependent transporter